MSASIVEDHPAEGARSLTLRLVRSITSDASRAPRVVVSVFRVEGEDDDSQRYLVRGFGRIGGERERDRDLESVLYEQGLAALTTDEAHQVAGLLYAELALRCGA